MKARNLYRVIQVGAEIDLPCIDCKEGTRYLKVEITGSKARGAFAYPCCGTCGDKREENDKRYRALGFIK